MPAHQLPVDEPCAHGREVDADERPDVTEPVSMGELPARDPAFKTAPTAFQIGRRFLVRTSS